MISATIDIEAARLLEYLRQVREAMGQHVAPVDLVGRAAGKVLEALPTLGPPARGRREHRDELGQAHFIDSSD